MVGIFCFLLKIHPRRQCIRCLLLLFLGGDNRRAVALLRTVTAEPGMTAAVNRDYNPKKKTVLAFAVGLHLSEDETIDLLKSAGYAFSDGSKRDWIVRYCLEHKIYNINQVNTLLFEYDQEQLGA